MDYPGLSPRRSDSQTVALSTDPVCSYDGWMLKLIKTDIQVRHQHYTGLKVNEVKEAFELAEKIGLRQSVFRTRRRPVDAENVGSLFTLGQAELHALVRGHFKGKVNNTGTEG